MKYTIEQQREYSEELEALTDEELTSADPLEFIKQKRNSSVYFWVILLLFLRKRIKKSDIFNILNEVNALPKYKTKNPSEGPRYNLTDVFRNLEKNNIVFVDRKVKGSSSNFVSLKEKFLVTYTGGYWAKGLQIVEEEIHYSTSDKDPMLSCKNTVEYLKEWALPILCNVDIQINLEEKIDDSETVSINSVHLNYFLAFYHIQQIEALSLYLLKELAEIKSVRKTITHRLHNSPYELQENMYSHESFSANELLIEICDDLNEKSRISNKLLKDKLKRTQYTITKACENSPQIYKRLIQNCIYYFDSKRDKNNIIYKSLKMFSLNKEPPFAFSDFLENHWYLIKDLIYWIFSGDKKTLELFSEKLNEECIGCEGCEGTKKCRKWEFSGYESIVTKPLKKIIPFPEIMYGNPEITHKFMECNRNNYPENFREKYRLFHLFYVPRKYSNVNFKDF